ncbi:MAG: hypothetical protein EOP86_03995 [Verrucomicrobiaceae bacterium]|nr:MAG: hypothetical protein EOP86_03995 [Verrucomicrobiaceae bacterium]
MLPGQIAQTAYVKAWNAAEYDAFGTDVAVSGNTLAVLATGKNPGVFVYVRDTEGLWARQAYLQGAGPEEIAVNNVAMDGDIIAMGYPQTLLPGGLEAAGCVDVFTRANGKWRAEVRLKSLAPAARGFFGDTVSVSGNTLVVGASGSQTTEVFVREAQPEEGSPPGPPRHIWRRQASLRPADPDLKPGNAGGGYAAVSGDTIAVGVDGVPGWVRVGDHDMKRTIGAIYVFTRKGTAWTQEARIQGSMTAERHFGYVLALKKDLLAAGSGEGTSLYDRVAGVWTLRGHLPVQPWDLALSDTSLLIGASGHDSGSSISDTPPPPDDQGAFGSGSAWLYRTDPRNWQKLVAYLKASNSRKFYQFGGDVALDGDTAAIAAAAEDRAPQQTSGPVDSPLNRLEWSGAVYVFNTRRAKYAVEGFAMSGDRFTLDFHSTPGITDWTLLGTSDPEKGFSTDLSPKTLFSEDPPGTYRAVVDVTGAGPRYFMRLEHD